MFTQSAWLDKLNQLPDEIFDRLSLNEIKNQGEKPVRCFLAGLGWEIFLKKLCPQVPWPKTKVFIATPSQPSASDIPKTENVDFFILAPPFLRRIASPIVINDTRKRAGLEGNFETKLSVFPPATFDLIVFLWNLPLDKPQNTLKLAYRSLKKNGQMAVVTPWESSPELPLTVLKKVLKWFGSAHQTESAEVQNRPLKLKMYKSDLPRHRRGLRKMLEKTHFKDVRVWSDSVRLSYPSAGSVFDDLLRMSEDGLFQKEITEATKLFIRGEFIKLFESQHQPSPEGFIINYDFGGAIGFK